jgi:protein-tyrosine kinase
MSRIELAMEKAAKLRESKGPQYPGSSAAAGSTETTGYAGTPPKLAPDHPFLVTLHDPQSPMAEEYRKLKGALLELSKSHEAFRNALLVTSSVPSEGKSLTALNLAISLAYNVDHSVLLVDADLRKPSLHRYLGIERGLGFADLLLERARAEEAIIPTGIGKLSLLRAGSEVQNPAELFSSSRMKALIQQLRNSDPGRFVIFDTPPVLPFAETRSLARLVDGVLFVVMERLVSQGNVHDSLEYLKGSHIIGTVYNAVLLAGHENRYSHYHGYYRSHDRSPSCQAVVPSKGSVPSP